MPYTTENLDTLRITETETEMKDTTLTELLDLMKAYAERHGIDRDAIMIQLSTLNSGAIGDLRDWSTIFSFNSLPDLIEKLKK